MARQAPSIDRPVERDSGFAARIFISHSCKHSDVGPVDAPDGSPEAQRQRTLEFAREVCERVEVRLSERFEVWLDKQLRPGEEWSAKLHRWLGLCDGAVILLDRESTRSDWLLKEATILAWRRDMGAQLTVVPVFLDEAGLDAIGTGPFRPLGLSSTHGVRRSGAVSGTPAAADELAVKVLEALAGVERRAPDTDFEDWLADVRDILEQVELRYLLKAAKCLQITKDDWRSTGDPDADLPSTLAHELLHAHLSRSRPALEALRDGVRLPSHLCTLFNLVRPTWVDVRAAQDLAAQLADWPPPVPVLPARYPETASDYIRRARCCKVLPERIIPGLLPTGADPVREGTAALLKVFCEHFGDPWPEYRDLTVAALRDEPPGEWFVVLGPSPVPPALVRELDAGFEPIGFVVLTDAEEAAALADAVGGRVVRPLLARDAEEQALANLRPMRKLLAA